MLVERTIIMTCLLLGMSLALADEEEMPDPDFLEYLGTWEESDEDWLIFNEPVTAEVDEERSEPAPEGEESTEKTDES
jgi:hypothetical protein